ncbi:hypothetical protein Syn7502_02647 [Synechococcus sp. PCC 7502]|uniref:hypothetical protein n=1 Tax=Synechococcus sp. PCC 7502 TaxID=1173263 RepID=UPI00029F8FF5|nr:hypothetical protein [Synechococcus sp. PCC 7502]AFY74606.1 hypothetical protein Syn7502_02647 [Synechococcus sp. PCC 7502]
MQFINSKQAYPIVLGLALSVLAIGVWQKFSSPTERYLPQTTPIVITEPPSTPEIVPNVSPAIGQGALRVGNLTEHPVRVVLLSRLSQPDAEPLNWDFVPGEGGSKGLELSLPQDRVKIKKGDILFAFATDGSRNYWGPIVVGESNAVNWQGDRWNFILKP